jgi:hypothetical protein
MPLRFSSHLPVGAVLVATVLTGCEDGRGTQAAAGACGAGSSAPDGEATAPVTDAGTLTPWAGPSAAGSDGPSRASEGGLAADSSARSPHGQGTSDGAALDASGADAAGPDTTTVGASADAGGALPRFSFFVTSQAAMGIWDLAGTFASAKRARAQACAAQTRSAQPSRSPACRAPAPRAGMPS